MPLGVAHRKRSHHQCPSRYLAENPHVVPDVLKELSGNIDIAGPLAFGSRAETRAEVEEHLEKLMPGGRYILSTNHSIMDGLKYENYLEMLDTLFECGIYH